MKTMPALETHPHEFQGSVPDRLPAGIIRELSVLKPGKAIGAIFVEWLGIAAAIALCRRSGIPLSMCWQWSGSEPASTR
jgi:hypothetical protein